MPISFTKTISRIIGYRGHRLVNTNYQWGVDALSDIRRLAKTQNQEVKSVLDIGAHFGEWALIAHQAFRTANIVSFEPYPESFAELSKRIKGNPRLTAVNLAASDKECNTELHIYENTCLNSLTNKSSWTVHSEWTPSATVEVKTERLDEWCYKNCVKEIDLLKVDTEGYDLNVLRGAERLFLNRSIRFVYVEFNSLQPKAGAHGGSLLPIDTFLKTYGFCFINSYLDNVGTKGGLFVTSNALFMLDPSINI